MKAYRFPRGGIDYQDTGAPDAGGRGIAFLPAISVIPLIQHSGAGAEAVVSVGQEVGEGMLIGRGRGPGSANVHATVPGTIIRTVSWPLGDGRITDALVIRLEGSFSKLGRREERFPWESLSRHDVLRLLSERGVVEMEEPGRPVSELLAQKGSPDSARTLVVRCVFDDPWRAADIAVCGDRGAALAEGAAIAVRASGCSLVVVAVSRREHDLGESLRAALEARGISASIAPVGNRYPQHNGRELELSLREYGRKEGLDLGTLISLSPSTIAAVYDAVALNKPILERYVAVGGSALKRPAVLRVRIGTRIGDVFAECGGFVEEPKRIAVGSPLKGREVVDLDEPITKTSYAVFALSESTINGGRSADCINCGECREVCPVSLDPERLFKLARSDKDTAAQAEGASECHGCGCCEAVCPSRLPLGTVIQTAARRGRTV